MPSSSDELERYHDRDLLVGVARDLSHFQLTITKMETDIIRRLGDLSTQINDRMDRIEQTQQRLELRIDKVESRQDRAEGGLGFGRWLIGVLVALPFLGTLFGLLVGSQ